MERESSLPTRLAPLLSELSPTARMNTRQYYIKFSTHCLFQVQNISRMQENRGNVYTGHYKRNSVG